MLPDTDVTMSDASPLRNLATLPSELRRLIVSHLAPSGPDDLFPGCKADLQNANLAHSCLREWVPEYMFRDMALECVIVGMASHLERFAAQPSNSGLLKHVKSIQVKVPPAIRWEVDNETEEFDTVEDLTAQRLCRYFEVDEPDELNDDQNGFAMSYHRALVEPFIDSRRWYNLLRDAQASWGSVFHYFDNLQEISVGCCERVDHPASTYTNVFVTRYGKDVIDRANPAYFEDSTVNMAWASAIVLEQAPEWVQSLRLGMVNIDHFNSFATVNRLMSIVYRNSQFLKEDPPDSITKLSLTLRGEGLHGRHDWGADTGSAGLIRYWSKVLPSMANLECLEFHQVETNHAIKFTAGQDTDEYESVLRWMLREHSPQKLNTLRLSKFSLTKETIQDMFTCSWPALTTVIFDATKLLVLNGDRPQPEDDPDEFLQEPSETMLRYIQGEGWLEICQFLTNKCPGIQIHLSQPESNIHDEVSFALHSSYVTELQRLGVQLSTDGFYDIAVRHPVAPFDPLFMVKEQRERPERSRSWTGA